MTTELNKIEILKARESSLKNRLELIDDDPQAWIRERKRELDDALRQVETQYEPEREGNVPMYEHLRELLHHLAVDAQPIVKEEKARVEEKLEDVTEQIVGYELVSSFADNYGKEPLPSNPARIDDYYARFDDSEPYAVVWYRTERDYVYVVEAWSGSSVIGKEWLDIAHDICLNTDQPRLELDPISHSLREHLLDSGFEEAENDDRLYYEVE